MTHVWHGRDTQGSLQDYFWDKMDRYLLHVMRISRTNIINYTERQASVARNKRNHEQTIDSLPITAEISKQLFPHYTFKTI